MTGVSEVFKALTPAARAKATAPLHSVMAPNPYDDASSAPLKPPIPFAWASTITTDLHELREIVESTFTAGGISVVYGESNSGKTTLVLDLAFRMPSGLPWLGKRTEKGAVIYIACEGAGSVKRRLAAYRQHHDCKVHAFGLISSSLNLMDPSADVEDLLDLIKGLKNELIEPVRLIVVDTVARAMAGANENASEDMSRLVGAADRIRGETGAHIVFVHHSGKDAAKGARGHSSLRAAVDTEIEVTADDAARTLTITKQRDLPSKGESLTARFVAIELGRDQWDNPVTACVVAAVDETSPHLAALMRQTDERRSDEVTLKGFRRLLEMGIKPTDGLNSPDFLPKQLVAKGLAEDVRRDDLVGSMNRLMARGVLTRSVIGQYTNRNPKFGLVLSGGQS